MPGQTSPWNLRYPTYTDSSDAAGQIQNLATDINTAFGTVTSSITAANNRVRCKVTRAAAQSIPNNAFTNITFTAEQFDNDNMANLGVDALGMVVVTAGLYLITARGSFASNATGERAARITTTALPLSGAVRVETVNGAATDLSLDIITQCAVGQQIRLSVFQNSGGALNIATVELAAVRLTG